MQLHATWEMEWQFGHGCSMIKVSKIWQPVNFCRRKSRMSYCWSSVSGRRNKVCGRRHFGWGCGLGQILSNFFIDKIRSVFRIYDFLAVIEAVIS